MIGFANWFLNLMLITNVKTTCFRLLNFLLLFSSAVQSFSCVQLFTTPWTAAHQASLPITNSQSLLKLMPIELVMPFNHFISCIPFSSCLQSFPASGSFPISQFFTSGGQSIGVSPSASVLPMNTQDWFPLGLTSLISCSPRDSQESSPTPQFKSINASVLKFLYGKKYLQWYFLVVDFFFSVKSSLKCLAYIL